MNKTYNVIFSKIRGALMVCNEITSSVQKKGSRLVVATAALLAVSGASVAAQQTLTIEESTAASPTRNVATVIGQFIKGSSSGGTKETTHNSLTTSYASDDYFSGITLQNVDLHTTKGTTGSAKLTGIETITLNNAKISVSSADSSAKSSMVAKSLSTNGGDNGIYVGEIGSGNGEFTLTGGGSLILQGNTDAFEVAAGRSNSSVSLTVNNAEINSTSSASFKGLADSTISLYSTGTTTVNTPQLTFANTNVISEGRLEFRGQNQELIFEEGTTWISAYAGVKAFGTKFTTKANSLAALSIAGDSSATELSGLVINNQGGAFSLTANGTTLSRTAAKIGIEKFTQAAGETTFDGDVTINEVAEGFGGKISFSPAYSGFGVSFTGYSTLTLKSKDANTIGTSLNMGAGNLTLEYGTNRLVIEDAATTVYDFEVFRNAENTGNSFVTVKGIAKAKELAFNDKHLLISAKALQAAGTNNSLTIDYAGNNNHIQKVSVTGLGNLDQSSLIANKILLKSGTLELGDTTDGNNSTFGKAGDGETVDFGIQGQSKLLVKGDTVHFGAITQEGNSEVAIESGAGTSYVHKASTLSGASFKNLNKVGDGPGLIFKSDLTVSRGHFETENGAITLVEGKYRQDTVGNTTVQTGGALNLLGGVEIAAGDFVSAGTTTASEINQTAGKIKVQGGTLNATSATLVDVYIEGNGKLLITEGDFSSADTTFEGNGTVEVTKLKANTDSLGKITVADTSTSATEGAFLYQGEDTAKIDSITLGEQDSLNFSAKNATIHLDAKTIGAADDATLKWDVKETHVTKSDTATTSVFKGKMTLADVGATETIGAKLNATLDAFNELFGQGKGKLDFGAKGSGADNQGVRNTLHITSGHLDLSWTTGGVFSGDGLITSGNSITLGAKYEGATNLQTTSELILGNTSGNLDIASGAEISAGGLALQQTSVLGTLKVFGTLNLKDGDATSRNSDIRGTNIEVAPTVDGTDKGLNLSGTEGAVTKLVTTGSLTTAKGGTTVGQYAELSVASAQATGENALKVDGGKMSTKLFTANASSTSITNGGMLEVSEALNATGANALTVNKSSVTTKELTANDGSITVSNQGTLTVTGKLTASGVNAIEISGTDSTLDAQGALEFQNKTVGKSVIEIKDGGTMKVKAKHALKKETDGIKSALSGMIGVDVGSSGFVELEGLADWFSSINDFEGSSLVGKEKKLSLTEVKQVLSALDGNPDKSKLLLKLGDSFDWSRYEITLGNENPIDYDEFKLITGVDASDKDLVNVNGTVTGTNSWGSASLKAGEDKLRLGSLGADPDNPDDDMSGNLTLKKPTADGYFVKNPNVAPGSDVSGDVELIGSAKTNDDPTSFKLVGIGTLGNVTASGNKAHTKITFEGKEGEASSVITAGKLGDTSSELGSILIDKKATVNAQNANASKIELKGKSLLNLATNLTTLEQTNTASSEKNAGDVLLTGESSLAASSASIAGSLTVNEKSAFKVDTATIGATGNVAVSGLTRIQGQGSSYFAKGESDLGDITIENSATFGYGTDGLASGGKLLAKANKTYTENGVEKTTNGTVTVTAGRNYRHSKLYASEASIDGTLTVNNSDVKTNGTLTVAGSASVTSQGTLLSLGESSLGSLALTGNSHFGYASVEEGRPSEAGGKLTTVAGTSYKDANGTTTVSTGDVTIEGRSLLFSEEANIAGKLTVKDASLFKTKENTKATVASDFTLDNHSIAEIGSELTIKGKGTITGSATLSAQGNASLGALDLKSGASFDIGDKKLTVSKNTLASTQTTGDVTLSNENSKLTAGEAEIEGNLIVENKALFTATGDATVGGAVTLASLSKANVSGDFVASGKVELSGNSELNVSEDATATGLVINASKVTIGKTISTVGPIVHAPVSLVTRTLLTAPTFGAPSTPVLTSDPQDVVVKNGGSLIAGNALLNEVKVLNEEGYADSTNILTFGSATATEGTKINVLSLAGNAELTFNGPATQSTGSNTNTIKKLTVDSGVKAAIKGVKAQYGSIAVSGNLDVEEASLFSSEGTGTLTLEGTEQTPATARFASLDLQNATSASVKNGLLAVGGESARSASLETLKAEAAEALSSARQTGVPVTSLLLVNEALTVPSGNLAVGDTSSLTLEPNTLGIGTGGTVFLDRDAMNAPIQENGKTKYTTKLSGNLALADGGRMIFRNLAISGKTVITLVDDSFSVTSENNASFLTGNFLYAARLTGNTLTFTMSEAAADLVGKFLTKPLKKTVLSLAEGEGFDSARQDGSGWISAVIEAATGDGDRITEEAARSFGTALESTSRMATHSGAFHVTDTVGHMTSSSIEERLGFSSAIGTNLATEETSGRTLWATPLYNKTKVDGLKAGYFNSGADIDLHGITVGADFVTQGETRFGAALYAGTGSAESRGALAKTKNSFDFYGASLYFGHTVNAFSFMGDVGYGFVRNDVKQTNHGALKADIDSSVFTVGVKAKYDFDVGGFQVAPFAGLRFNRIDAKNYKTKASEQGTLLRSNVAAKNYVELPVGLQLAKAITTTSGWTMKPTLDLSLTPTFGSRNLKETIRFTGVSQEATTSSEVLDRVRYSATFGITGGKDNFGFGVSAGYTGSKHTDALAVKANVRWTF